LLASETNARAAAVQTVTANQDRAGEFAVTCDPNADIIYYGPGTTNVPGFGALGPAAQALRVVCHVPLNYTFGRVIGLTSTTVSRAAVVVRGPLGGVPIAPMWISHDTPYSYGQYQDLLMAGQSHYADIPGNFGWLALPSGVSASWSQVMSGDPPITDADKALLMTDIDDIVNGKTGLSVGQWTTPLLSRISRGSTGIYAGETWDHCSPTNPRIMVIPLVSYIGGTGSGATYHIEKYGAFWLGAVHSTTSPKSIDGRFIQYAFPGGSLDALANDTGLSTYRLAG
jgi:hypothetical protein